MSDSIERRINPDSGPQTTEEYNAQFKAQNQIAKDDLGCKRVRYDFNPSSNQDVDHVKKQTAQLINYVEGLKEKDPRLAALAQTAYEEAAMWAVKLATA